MRFTVQRSLGPQGGSGIWGREAHAGIRPNGSLQNDHRTIVLKWLVETWCIDEMENDKLASFKPKRVLLSMNPGPCVNGEDHKQAEQSNIWQRDKLLANPGLTHQT